VAAANDMAGVGCYSALDECSLQWPEDISVIGFNDMPFHRPLRPPSPRVRFRTTSSATRQRSCCSSAEKGRGPGEHLYLAPGARHPRFYRWDDVPSTRRSAALNGSLGNPASNRFAGPDDQRRKALRRARTTLPPPRPRMLRTAVGLTQGRRFSTRKRFDTALVNSLGKTALTKQARGDQCRGCKRL